MTHEILSFASATTRLIGRSYTSAVSRGATISPRGVVNACVAVAINQDDVVGPAESADERQTGLIPGAENDGVALAEPLGEFFLEFLVQRQRAVRCARSGRPGAVFVQSFARRVYDFGME